MTLDKASWGYRREAKAGDYLSIHELITTMAQTISCGGKCAGLSIPNDIKLSFSNNASPTTHYRNFPGNCRLVNAYSHSSLCSIIHFDVYSLIPDKANNPRKNAGKLYFFVSL